SRHAAFWRRGRSPAKATAARNFRRCLVPGARQVGASRCKFVAASVTGLALADAGFDKVACSAVLQHVADAGTVMDELARVCAPRGRMLLGVPNNCMSTAPALALLNLVNRFERRGL